MIDTDIDDNYLFLKYFKGKKKTIFPWSLSIVDCFYIVNAFRKIAKAQEPLKLTMLSIDEKETETRVLSDAYDLYEVDSDVFDVEVVLIHEESRACCYWDDDERFVAITGPDEFMSTARPYPDDIEKHYYVELMLYFEESVDSDKAYEKLRSFYDAVKSV